jgi:hypothetical protein
MFLDPLPVFSTENKQQFRFSKPPPLPPASANIIYEWLLRNMQKHGLAHLYEGNEEFRTWMLRIMAIPLLPAGLIKEAFKVLLRTKISNLNQTDLQNFNKFRRYLQRQWARKVKPKNLSVHGLDQQTNNGAESFHAWLKAVIKSHKPNFWTFVYHLNR